MNSENNNEADTEGIDFTPSRQKYRAAEYDNVFPRHQSLPVIRNVSRLAYKPTRFISELIRILIGHQAGYTTHHIAFTTFFITIFISIVAAPAVLTYTVWQYLNTGTPALPTVISLTGTEPGTTLLHYGMAIVGPTPTPVLVAVYILIAYAVSTVLHEPWDEFTPGYFSPRDNRVNRKYSVKDVQHPVSRLNIALSIIGALIATTVLYTTLTVTHPGPITTIILTGLAGVGYLIVVTLTALRSAYLFTKVSRLLIIFTLPFLIPLSHTQFGIMLLTVLPVLAATVWVPIRQLRYDWSHTPDMDYYPRAKWVIGTWGILLAATTNAVLNGPLQITVAGYATAQLVTLMFFIYRRRIPTGKSFRRTTVRDYHGTTSTSVHEIERDRLEDELQSRMNTDEVREFFTNPLPSADDEIIEDIRYAIWELNEAAEPYIDEPPFIDESGLDSLSKPDVKRINRQAATLANDEDNAERVRRAASRVEHVTDQALNGWNLNDDTS